MSCFDCGREYGAEHGFPDLLIPYWAWKEISPTGDEGGLLCPSCMCKRLHDKNIHCVAAFASPNIETTTFEGISLLRRVENIELALEGRMNKWGALLRERIEDVADPEASILRHAVRVAKQATGED